MRERRTGRVGGLCATIAVMGLAFCPTAGAAEEEKKQPSPLERLQKDLLDTQNNITASKMKLARGPMGVSEAVAEAGARPKTTPAEACCIPHIEKINQKLQSISETVDRLDPWYAEQHHAEALEGLDQIRNELMILGRGAAVFKMAGTKGRAGEALQGLIGPFNRLRTAIDGLEECCPLDQTADGNWKAKAPVR